MEAWQRWRRRHLVAFFTCILVFWSGVHVAPASDEPDESTSTVTLPEMVVTATRSDKDAKEVPYQVGQVAAWDIQSRKLSRTTPEALREVPSVLVQKTAHGQGSPFIRGFTGYHTLFLIDGIRLNNSVFRAGPNQYWNTVDPFTIDRLEVVKGPGSVLYGSDAVGGTVNAISPSPFEADMDGDWGGRGYYRYSTAEDSHTIRGEGRALSGDQLGLQAGVTYKDFGDLEAGQETGRQPKTGYDEIDIDAKAEYYVSPDTKLTLAHQTVDQEDAWRTHKTIFGKSFRGTTIGSEKERSLDQRRHLTYARLQADNLDGWANSVDLTLSHHRQEEEQFRIKSDDSSDRQGIDVDTLGVGLQLASPSDFGDWIYGLEYYHDQVDSFSKKYNADGSLKSVGIQGPVADDSTYDTLGVYAQDTLKLGSLLDMILGARYEYIEADAGAFEDPITGEKDSLSEDWDALVGSVRFLYRLLPDHGVNVYAGASQGFRAPNFSDLTRLDTARTDEIETAAPGLDPEYFVSYEGGVRMVQQSFQVDAAYYYTDISDLIVRTPTGRTIDGLTEVTKKNAGDGYVHGVELSGQVRMGDDFVLWGNLAWMDGEVDTFPTSSPEKVREPLDRLLPLTANLALRYEPSSVYWIEAIVTAADEQDNLSTRDKADTQRIPPGGTPGYTVLTFRGGWSITPDFTISLALENVTDEDYRIHGSGLNEPGRNFVCAVDYAF